MLEEQHGVRARAVRDLRRERALEGERVAVADASEVHDLRGACHEARLASECAVTP
jgi:hypothetical protein